MTRCWWHHLWLLLSTDHEPQVSSEVLPSARASQMNPQLTAGMGKEPYRKLWFIVFYCLTFAKGIQS